MRWLRKEIRELLPIWAYCYAAGLLLRLTQSVFLSEHGIPSPPSIVLPYSLIVAKVFLIADAFEFVDRFRGKPLVYAIAWKTGIYAVGSILVRGLEETVVGVSRGEALQKIFEGFHHKMSLPQFWIIQLWIVILLLILCTVRELTRALGRERLHKLLLG
ncbi:MAG: hypothetical protein ACXWPM_05185 [Bdellovibrionota bacterium]